MCRLSYSQLSLHTDHPMKEDMTSTTSPASHLRESRVPYSQLVHGIAVYAYDCVSAMPPGHEPELDEKYQPLDTELFAYDAPSPIFDDPASQALYEHLITGIVDEYTVDPANPAHGEPRWYTLGYQVDTFTTNYFAHNMYLGALQSQLWPEDADPTDQSLPFWSLITLSDTRALIGPAAITALHADFLAHPVLADKPFNKNDLVHQRWKSMIEKTLDLPSMTLVLASN